MPAATDTAEFPGLIVPLDTPEDLTLEALEGLGGVSHEGEHDPRSREPGKAPERHLDLIRGFPAAVILAVSTSSCEGEVLVSQDGVKGKHYRVSQNDSPGLSLNLSKVNFELFLLSRNTSEVELCLLVPRAEYKPWGP